MWLAILTPGPHPSASGPPGSATVFAWTPDDRRRIEGPFDAVHGGLRVVRRMFHEQRLTASPPRCFDCLRPCAVPDPARAEEAEPCPADAPEHAADAQVPAPPPERAVLFHVHVPPLVGGADPPLDEEVLVTAAGTHLALLTPLWGVPRVLSLVGSALVDEPPAACAQCGAVLPGSAAQLAADAARPAQGRRPAGPRRGAHARRAA